MNILLAPNDYYVMPGLALLESLYEHEEDLEIYIIESGLSKENILLLKSSCEKHEGVNIHFIKISNDSFKEAYTSIHITKEAYYRLLAQNLLPKTMERILYLDLDIITLKSLRSFYEEDFENSYMIVCEGMGVSQKQWAVYDELKIPHQYKYFNSGVLLMNLELMRKEVNPQIMIDFITEHGDNLKYHDQDTLNALFFDKVKYIDWHIYNQTIIHIRDKAEANERLEKACIIHYAGSDKPWKFNYCSWYFNLFWKYAKKAGFCNQYNKIRLQRFFWHLKNKLHC